MDFEILIVCLLHDLNIMFFLNQMMTMSVYSKNTITLFTKKHKYNNKYYLVMVKVENISYYEHQALPLLAV